MALTSPGVQVTIIDQSQYLPAATNSVPLVVFATAQNKSNPSGTGVAAGTTAANAGKLYQITSQKDLADFYGVPFFYTTTNGTPIQGYELNEYGLLAAYSALGVTNRVYCLRADIDLAAFVGTVARPSGAPTANEYWQNITTSTYGIYQFNATTGTFTEKTPIVINDTAYLSGGFQGFPLDSIGNIGDYCVVPNYGSGYGDGNQYFYKTIFNFWTVLGSRNWARSWPTIQATNSNPTLNAGDSFVMNFNGLFNITVTVPAGPNNTVTGLVTAINNLNYYFLQARNISGKLVINSMQNESDNPYLEIVSETGTVLEDLGIETGIYYQPQVQYGTSAEMPLWTSSQQYPHPTGSVWIKVGANGMGLNPVISKYNAVTAAWTAQTVNLALNDWSIDSSLDATGGQAIPAGTIYGQYNSLATSSGGQIFLSSPTEMYIKGETGPTIAIGTETDFIINLNYSLGSASLYVQTSIPNSSSLSSTYTVTIPDNCTPTDFVTAWSAQNIQYTSAEVNSDGAVVLTHTEGGQIVLNDYIQTAGANKGKSAGILLQAGFIAGTTNYVKRGPSFPTTFTSIATTGGAGSNCTVNIGTTVYNSYQVTGAGVTTAGTGYAVGNTLTVSGALLGGATTTNDVVVKVASVNGSGGVTAVTLVSGTAITLYSTQISNWEDLTYTINEIAPVANPANGTPWYYSVVDEVDIMVQANGQWNGYKNINYDTNGFPAHSGVNATDPNGPIVSATEPTTQSDDTALVYGDLWIDTSAAALENYPVISRWQYDSVSMMDMWVLIDNSNQTSSTGVLFADARWATNGVTNIVDDPIPTITSLLTSDYLDLDAPDPALYPTGMLLFNTRRSGYNVKEYQLNYFTGTKYPDDTLPDETATWLSVSGLQSNGSPYMGRKAQRQMVVKALRSAIDTNTDLRDQDNFFNLMATPNYPELQPNMVVLNADRGETAYILGDTPMRLPADATAIQAWATNAAGATSTGEEGCVTRNTYLGLFYPSGLTSDLSGNIVAVPASHMMLRTFLRNDTIAYPWLAAAGTRRGNIDNATNIGYLDSTTGEFITIKTRLGIRDVLYINFINPLVFFTGVGLLNYGNKTSYDSQSALDRTNVARLIAYVRRQLELAARPFVFEPNDALTRNQIQAVIQTLMVDLVAKRGIYDYLVICDDSNNTPARIDRNELWVDVAIEPVKAAEFIYIPVRVLNTGEIASL
jgi:hypothetical protein